MNPSRLLNFKVDAVLVLHCLSPVTEIGRECQEVLFPNCVLGVCVPRYLFQQVLTVNTHLHNLRYDDPMLSLRFPSSHFIICARASSFHSTLEDFPDGSRCLAAVDDERFNQVQGTVVRASEILNDDGYAVIVEESGRDQATPPVSFGWPY